MEELFVVACACICTLILYLSHDITTSAANGEILPLQGDVAINCGCLSNSTAHDGRHWVGETPLLQPKGKSRIATSAAVKLLMADPTPFLTSRISSSHFSYIFQVNPGQKFVRLHFCPASYQGFGINSQDLFTVKANSFTLLQNFSASLAADALGIKYFVKEYCLNVNETGILQMTFSASRDISIKSINTFVFVNGIEIISMPTNLYYTPDDNLGVPVIGQKNGFFKVDNNTALELIQRLNVGGGSVLPVEDTGMFRRWSEDVDYLLASSSRFQPIKHLVPPIEYIVQTPFLAPLKIYQTSRIFRKGSQNSEEKHHFTWKLRMDIGFCYLLRLHLCSFIGEIAEGSPKDFDILIQNVIAESRVNAIQLSGGNGIAMYRDYLVMMRGDKTEGKRDLFISLQSNDEFVLGIVKGLEIFKLSNIDNSLVSLNPSCPIRNSSFWSLKIQNFMVGFGHLDVIITALTFFLAMVNAAVYKLRQIYDYEFVHDKHVQLASDKDKHGQFAPDAPDEPSCHHFSLAQILLATQNFDDALVIGKGGFGKVYKGLVYGRPEVLAIKRLNSHSNQGANEFWREIETLSKLRHIHLVPLIGYCNESDEMILVYEYMPRGTIADNIYKSHKNGNEGVHLTWEQRLRICIGAARGLDYLHTGTQYGVIHRDVKDTNILLDDNYVAKISDFGLSKQGSTTDTKGQLSTNVKGTPGYVDPHYLTTHKPSISSDIYAFGIVMLVVISGRPALELKFYSENVSLLALFRDCMERGDMKEIIDPRIQGENLSESLTKFIEVVVNCVHHLPKKRPTMAQVVVFLEHALEKHLALDGQSCSTGSNQPFEFYELQAPPIPEESVVCDPIEGNSGKEIQKDNLAAKEEVLQPREMDHNKTHKPLWGRKPWFTLKKIRKPTKKKDPQASETSIPQASETSFPQASKTRIIFPIQEIKSVTQNFSDEFKIGKRGFYDVYRAPVSDGSRIFEIKRSNSADARASESFWRQIEFLKLGKPHINLLPLLGYCVDDTEKILVYEYTPYVTLDNYLYKNSRKGEDAIFLPWEKRLRICKDTALGLHHLHKSLIVHGDFNTCNIMLNEHFVPMISGFGYYEKSFRRNIEVFEDSFVVFESRQSGYLDPYYAVTDILTEASDVYSFGIMLLVVLCGRQPVDQTLPSNEQILKIWFRKVYEEGSIEKIIDPNLKDKTPLASLEGFVELINNCLLVDPKSRPAMDQVVANLEMFIPNP